jgi:hypothetical protein
MDSQQHISSNVFVTLVANVASWLNNSSTCPLAIGASEHEIAHVLRRFKLITHTTKHFKVVDGGGCAGQLSAAWLAKRRQPSAFIDTVPGSPAFGLVVPLMQQPC